MEAKDWISLFQAAGTFSIAGVAAYIAWKQSHVAAQKLKFDLYNSRILLYRAILKYQLHILRREFDVIDEKALVQLYIDIEQSRFLFDEHVFGILSGIYEQMVALHFHIRLGQATYEDVEERRANVAEVVSRTKRLQETISELPKHLERYLLIEEDFKVSLAPLLPARSLDADKKERSYS